MEDVLTLILGGGRGTRLYPLTKTRSKPAVPIAGKYRLIDIPVSNCINSGLSRIYVLTQYLSVSLHRHISNTYKFGPFSRGFVEILAAQQTNETADWYQGASDAVRQNRRYILDDPGREVLVLAGDQLYRMDFRLLLQSHRESQADVTIAVTPVSRSQAPSLGIVRLNEIGRITAFVEKPQTDEELEPLRTSEEWRELRSFAGRGRPYLASMGIYVFNRTTLFDLIDSQPRAHSFGPDIFPTSIHAYHFQAHLFDGYWENVGTLRAYHQASLALASDQPPFDFHSPEGVVFTHMRNLPASRVSAAHVEQCLLSDGCVIEPGARLERSVIGVRSHIGRNVTLRDTVLMGANYFDRDRPTTGASRDVPPLGVGDDSVLEGVIADKNCRIGRGVHLVNRNHVQEAERDCYMIRDGIVVVPNGAVVPDGTVI
jgi:glucose-1-phosphate adenylyltransferase